jgi:hypothetical protein
MAHPTASESRRCRRVWACGIGVVLCLSGVTTGQSKLGETLPQLLKRFGATYTEEGTEKGGDLKYKFRLETYSVDVMMSRRGDKLVSNLEIYYSDKPLQANGDPPTAIVRGVMNVNVPGAKWHETTPVGGQKAAFLTADGAYMAAILPPNKTVEPNATFTVAVCRIRDGGSPNGQQMTNISGQAGEAGTTPPANENASPGENAPRTPAADPLAVTLSTGKVVHFQTLEEKSNYEAAMGASPVSAQTPPVSEAPSTLPVRVIGHITRDGVEMLQLSDGNFAVRAQLEAKVYENNEIAADQTFKGRNQPIFGVISQFGVDILGYPFLILDQGENSLTGVQCTFSKDDAPALATMQKGSIVALTGKHNGKLFNVQIGDCALIPWAKFDYNAPEVQRATSVPKHSR